MYQHPGVYIEHIPSGLLSIEAASTSTAAFIGPVPRGPVGEPVFIFSRDAFVQQFGELNDPSGGVRDLGQSPDYFGYAVNSFFDNGGGKAYVIRVAANDAEEATGALADPDAPGANGLYMTAKNPGAWANRLIARIAAVDENAPALGYALTLGSLKDDGDIAKPTDLLAIERFAPVFTDPNHPRFIGAVVNAGSALVKVERKPIGSGAGGTQITALKTGDLSGLNFNDLKSKTLTLKVNGTAVEISFNAALKQVSAKVGTTTKTSTASSSAIASLTELAGQLNDALCQHADLAKMSVVVTGDFQLLFIPPVNTGGASKVDTPGGDAQAILKLDPAATGAADKPSNVDYPSATTAQFFGGTDGGAVAKANYDPVFTKIRDYRDISIILLPGQFWSESGNTIVDAAITHSEFMQNRMVIVDTPDPLSGATYKLDSPKSVVDLGLSTSPYTAHYYPWLIVPNPHYDKDTAPQKPKTFATPPSPFAAGMWARIDGSRGVWKAPAGLEATVRGSQGPNVLVGNDIQDNLNELGVNCLRAIIGPTVIWGARTLATKSKPEFRYVPVRRTQSMIGESLYSALQAVVFEPNDHKLWASLRGSVGDFMDGLFRSGAFQGEKASEAYFVRCGLNSTMTQGDIDSGVVRVVVGFAPLKPAEFVVVQIQQIVGQRG